MADALLFWFRNSLPAEVLDLVAPYLANLDSGDYQAILKGDNAQALFGHVNSEKTSNIRPSDFPSWSDFIFHRIGIHLADRTKPEKQYVYFCIGYAALLAFMQTNVTGPPLPFSASKVLLPEEVSRDSRIIRATRQALLANFNIDGIAAYKLTPDVELLALADAIMTSPPVLKNIKGARWAKMRVVFMQQRLLSEVSSTLQNVIYDDLDMLNDEVIGSREHDGLDVQTQVEFLLERAAIHIHHGLDKLSRQDLEDAKRKRRFEYALTGSLGKRTKYQEKDYSQLVVLAKSHGEGDNRKQQIGLEQQASPGGDQKSTGPVSLDLNDDTLLESISFTRKGSDPTIGPQSSLPESLKDLDPGDQPKLDPCDSTLLLSFASSITNTSPEHGLTREETLPYAERVINGGSSNWQVYTQALLVRSRIEGYKSRTVERGLLQLQALVDQVVADTTGSEAAPADQSATSFLPRPKEGDSAPVTERLRYVFQLASPTRWDLEAELAARWVQLGGLKSALDIYERLEMWAEAAVCLAMTEREEKARNVVRRQLCHRTAGGDDGGAGEDEKWEGEERKPPPPDAPRLYCILGDIDQSVEMYEKAWEVSGKRYARAQRSLGRHYMTEKDFVKAAEAYSKSLKANGLNQSSWFALGCALLELDQFWKAAEAFSRCVQLDDTDAESWSNLAAALLHIDPTAEDAVKSSATTAAVNDADDDQTVAGSSNTDPQRHRIDALKALTRAASLKRDSYRIWENLLTVSASISPPEYPTMLSAQKQLIALRGSTAGEKCIDKQILNMLASYVIQAEDTYDPSQPGLPRMFVKFIDANVVPLITGSPDLWRLVSKLAIWRKKPSSALEAEEKAWRVVTAQPGWEEADEGKWRDVVEATLRLCDAYEGLGMMERTEGLGAGGGEVVEKGWRFKARSAVRGVMGKGKMAWKGTEGWEKLAEKAEELKG